MRKGSSHDTHIRIEQILIMKFWKYILVTIIPYTSSLNIIRLSRSKIISWRYTLIFFYIFCLIIRWQNEMSSYSTKCQCFIIICYCVWPKTTKYDEINYVSYWLYTQRPLQPSPSAKTGFKPIHLKWGFIINRHIGIFIVQF